MLVHAIAGCRCCLLNCSARGASWRRQTGPDSLAVSGALAQIIPAAPLGSKRGHVHTRSSCRESQPPAGSRWRQLKFLQKRAVHLKTGQ